MWSRLDRFKLQNFNLRKPNSVERDPKTYYRTLYDLAQVLPVAGNKILLDKVIMPLLEEQLIAIAQGGNNDESSIELLSESTIEAMKSMTIAPGGIFRYLLNLLKTAKGQFSGSTNNSLVQILPICVQSLQLITISQFDKNQKTELSEYFIFLVMSHLNCVEHQTNMSHPDFDYSIENWNISTSDVRLELISKFYIEQLYKCAINSTSFRFILFETDGIRDVLSSLLEKGLRLIADSNEIFVSEEAAYLSVASSPVRLHLRAEIFAIILGLYSFFIYNGHHSGPTQPSIRQFESSTLPELRFSLVKNLRLNQENTESWTLIWHNLIKAALEPDIESVIRPTRSSIILPPPSGQARNTGSDNASGYEASSEDELDHDQNNLSSTNCGLNSVPTIYHPELVKFIFVAFSEFRQKDLNEDDDNFQLITCLIAMLKYMLDLFKMKKNVSICAEKDVIRVILKEFSKILDAPSNSEASGYLLQLFSASSAYKVSADALKIIVNKLTNNNSPIPTITDNLLDLFNNTSKMTSHILIPSKKESYSNILESATQFLLNNKTDYFNSIWNRALLHYKILNAVTKKTPFEWSSVFWLKICKDVHRETKV